jgi:hypothetical protein
MRTIIRWKHVEAYFKKRKPKYIIQEGSDVVIALPKPNVGGMRTSVRIPEKCCSSKNSEVTSPYLRQIQIAFGITPEMILADICS